MATVETILDSVLAQLATRGSEFGDQDKRLKNWSAAELRDRALLANQLCDPDGGQTSFRMSPTETEI